MCSVMICIAAYGDGIDTHTYIYLTGAISLGMEITLTAMQGVSFCSKIGVINITKLFDFSQGKLFYSSRCNSLYCFCSRSAFINGYIFSIFHL